MHPINVKYTTCIKRTPFQFRILYYQLYSLCSYLCWGRGKGVRAVCEWVERTGFGSIFKGYEYVYLITVIQIVEEKCLVGYVVD